MVSFWIFSEKFETNRATTWAALPMWVPGQKVQKTLCTVNEE